MVKPCSNFPKENRGTARILEGVIAAIIIFVAFSVSVYLLQSSDARVFEEKSDMDRLSYNVLHTLVESGTIEETLELEPFSAAPNLKSALQRSLPSSIYFNLTVFNCTESENNYPAIELTPIPLPINNTSTGAFTKSIEVSSTSMTFTSKQGNIYHIVLMLARPGGEGA